MADKIRVMIVDDIAETREQLRKLLSFDPDIEVVAMASSGEQAIELVPNAYPDVILMDINLPGMDGIATTGKVIEILPMVQVIMLSVQGETDYMRRAMMAGARDYLTKPPSADDLLDAIHRAFKLRQKIGTGPLSPMAGSASTATSSAPGRSFAKIITVYSPKGGTGCTTMAVNMAIALQSVVGNDKKICLIDGNLQFGDVAVFMKLQPTRTLSDLAPHTEDMDVDLLNTIVVPHPTGVKVLTPPASPEEAELFKAGGVEETGANSRFKAIVEFTQRHYHYIIIDTAHQVDDILLAALDLSDLFMVVTRPVIPEIRGARMFIELLQKLNYAMDGVALIINSVDTKRMGIQPEAIERAMMPAIAHIPMDERMALRAANYGEPLMIAKNVRSTQLGQSLIDLAKAVQERFEEPELEKELVAEEQPQRRSGLGRLL